MEDNDNHSQGVRALRLAALLQAALGAGVTALGAAGVLEIWRLRVPRMDFQMFIYVSYLAIGLAAMLIALPLARRVRWAWLASWALTSALLLLPFTDMISVHADSGSLHGSEGSLLLLLAALPTLLILGPLYSKGRSALIN